MITETFSGKLVGPEGARRFSALGCPGGNISYQTIVPDLGKIMCVTNTFAGVENIVVSNKVIGGRKLVQTMDGNPMQQTLWVDHLGYILRIEQTNPFGQMETIRTETKPNAEHQIEADLPANVYARTVIPSNITVPHPRRISEMTIRIYHRKPELGWPDFRNPEQEILEQTADHVLLRIHQPTVPSAGSPGSQLNIQPYLAANSLLQADDDQIKQQAMAATRGRMPGLDSALALQKWVADNMTPDMGIAIVPASEVPRDRHGTCVGYSIFLASLTRAASIPSRIRMGYVYTHGAWGGHAWAELHINGAWLPFDSSLYYPGPSDAARFSAIITPAENGVIDNVAEFGRIAGSQDRGKHRYHDHRLHGGRNAGICPPKHYFISRKFR